MDIVHSSWNGLDYPSSGGSCLPISGTALHGATKAPRTAGAESLPRLPDANGYFTLSTVIVSALSLPLSVTCLPAIATTLS
jgi:hypothetical protein